jgi:hypothetical protein
MSVVSMTSFLGVGIDFEQPQYSVNEENGTIEVCAVIMEGGLERNITITLATRNGTATGMYDACSYGLQLLPRPVVFNACTCMCHSPGIPVT